MMALLLALVAGMTPFVVEPDRVHAQEASDDSTLSNLTLSVGKLDVSFTAADYDYAVSVPARTNSIRVTATPNIQGAQVKVFYEDSSFTAENQQSMPDDATLASGNTVPLPANSTRYIGIEVTALGHTEINAQQSVYRVDVTRISADASSDAKLSALTISVGTLSPAFKPDVTGYTALVANNRGVAGSPFEVTPTLSDPDGDVDPAGGATFVITSSRNDTRLVSAGTMPLSVGQNVITIKVTAENLVTKETYTLTVTRAAANASDDARLRSLSLSGGIALSPTFEPGKLVYIANVSHTTTQTTVRFAVNHSGARATVRSPGDFNALAAGHQVFLGVGANIIMIDVTAENAVAAPDPYMVTVNRAAANASSDAKLDGLSINAGTETPAFNENVKNYTALVPNNRGVVGSTFEVTPVSPSGASFVITSDKASGIDTAVSGSPTTVALSVGANVITIKVTAQDLVTKETYTLTVTRAAANASDDARLSALMVGGQPVDVSDFTGDDAIADHTAGVPNGVNSITIDATPNHSGAIVVIKTGVTLSDTAANVAGTVDADGTVGLNVATTDNATNDIAIEVTAEDGSTVAYYFLQITRAAAGASRDAKLSALAINAGTLSPAFDKGVMSYTALVANNRGVVGSTFEVTPAITNAANSTFAITSDRVSGIDTAVSGSPTTVALMEGANVITIKVTAQDLVTKETYTLTVTRAAANASDDARLSALMVGGQPVDVSDFTGDDAIADHTAGVPNGVNSITIDATPNHSGAIVVIKTGVTLSDTAANVAGTVDADGTVGLNVATTDNATNDIAIEVTAEDGSTVAYYFLQITRAAAGASRDAKLDDLILSGITISPAFNGNTMMYSADVPVNIASTTVTAEAVGAEADDGGDATSVVITSDKDDTLGSDGAPEAYIARHTINLSAGANVITIMVTAEDYETTATYTVRVTRGVSNDATLSSLSLMTIPTEGTGEAIDLEDMDGMMAEFMADIDMYYADVDAGVDMINVMATAMDSDATVSGDGAVSLDVGENTITVTVTAEDGTTMMTYTVMVTVAPPVEGTLLERYDTNPENGIIDKAELREAILHFIAGDIDTAQMRAVIILYITG